MSGDTWALLGDALAVFGGLALSGLALWELGVRRGAATVRRQQARALRAAYERGLRDGAATQRRSARALDAVLGDPDARARLERAYAGRWQTTRTYPAAPAEGEYGHE